MAVVIGAALVGWRFGPTALLAAAAVVVGLRQATVLAPAAAERGRAAVGHAVGAALLRVQSER